MSSHRLIAGSAGFAALIGALEFGASTLEARAATQTETRWFKGNTHTHTINSDGDTAPDEVVRWYREHDYQFLVLSDHNFLTSVDGVNGLFQRFLVIPGRRSRTGSRQRINGLNVDTLPQGGGSVLETVSGTAIRGEWGHINHPRLGQRRRAGAVQNNLFESHDVGGGGSPGLEQIRSCRAASCTASLSMTRTTSTPWNAESSRPGQGWIYVRAERLSASAILDAMERGDFYDWRRPSTTRCPRRR